MIRKVKKEKIKRMTSMGELGELYSIIRGYKRNKNFTLEDLFINLKGHSKKRTISMEPSSVDYNIGTVKYGNDYKKYILLEGLSGEKYWENYKIYKG